MLKLYPLCAQGIHFSKESNWEELKAKAYAENKYIFVDCYATWCLPCKKMDNEVYPIDSVGFLVNKNFISIKVQMDSTKNDDDNIKQWYPLAKELNDKYKINVLPTYLFFDSKGQLLHKGFGFKTPNEFLDLVTSANDPEKQYYTLLERYFKNELSCSSKNYLAKTAQTLLDYEKADSVGKNYIHDCLSSMPESRLWTKDNIEFMNMFTTSSSDKSFVFFYKNSDRVNKIMNYEGYAQSLVERIIYKESIYPHLIESHENPNQHPNWDSLRSVLIARFDDWTVNSAITYGKLSWYKGTNNNELYCKYLIEKIEKYSSDSDKKNAFYINNSAWDIFSLSSSEEELKIASKWMESFLEGAPDDYYALDTYANILYKLGDVAKAIEFQKKAVEISGEEDFRSTLKKMKAGVPTWDKLREEM